MCRRWRQRERCAVVFPAGPHLSAALRFGFSVLSIALCFLPWTPRLRRRASTAVGRRLDATPRFGACPFAAQVCTETAGKEPLASARGPTPRVHLSTRCSSLLLPEP